MGAAAPATHSAKASSCRVLQLFLSCWGEAPGVGRSLHRDCTRILENCPAPHLPCPCGPGGAVHVHSIVTTQ